MSHPQGQPTDTLPKLQPAPIVITDRSTVLIIEDDPLQIELLEEGLSRNGFHVLSCATASAGLRLAKSELPDVILLDLGLPDGDGMKLCERLADEPETVQTPIIVISGTTDDDVVRRSRASGGKFFLHKPFDPNTLLLLINKAIDDRVSWY
ncbi:MAG: response regulator [Pirellulaceae bacterium]